VLGGPLTGLLVGLLMGLAQSTSLNKQMSSLRWIGISTLAAALGFLVGNLVSWMIPSLFICASITGLVHGIVSGMLLSGRTPDGSAGDAMDNRSNVR
jgi:small basic protein